MEPKILDTIQFSVDTKMDTLSKNVMIKMLQKKKKRMSIKF